MMGWPLTLAAFILGLVLTVYFSISTRRPKNPLHVPLVPPTLFLFIGILLILLAGSHALTLLGIEHNRGQLRLN
jgi:hypothetical protein